MSTGVLLHISYAHISRNKHIAAVGRYLAVNNTKKRSFSDAVSADKTYLVSVFDIKTYILEEFLLDKTF